MRCYSCQKKLIPGELVVRADAVATAGRYETFVTNSNPRYFHLDCLPRAA